MLFGAKRQRQFIIRADQPENNTSDVVLRVHRKAPRQRALDRGGESRFPIYVLMLNVETAMAVDLTEGVTPPPESIDLFDVLRQLPLMTDYFHLQMQARNIAITDRSLEQMEHDLLQLKIQGDDTLVGEAILLNAWSQMWVFAFFELMRTWKLPAKDFLNFSRKLTRSNAHAQAQLIENKTAQIKKSARLTLDRGTFHLKARRWVAENPTGAETALNTAIQRTSLLSRMLADVRTGLAKHQIQGSSTFAPHPGYGRISPLNGSISGRVMYEKENAEALISRRDLADECRAIMHHHR